MSFDLFSSDPNPPQESQRRDLVIAAANRRMARRRAVIAGTGAVLLVAAVLPLALRLGDDTSDVRTRGRNASQPTATFETPPGVSVLPTELRATTTQVQRGGLPTTPTPTTIVRVATPCTPTPRVEPVNRGRILFARQPDAGARPVRVYAVEPDGSGLTQLTDGSFDNEPAWSPDGNRIVFARTAQLHVMNADGTNVRKLTDGPDTEPSWSPDGTQIAFVRQNPFALMVVRADGTGMTTVLALSEKVPNSPTWSPDGCRLIFGLCCVEHGLWSIRPDGSGLAQLRTTGSGVAVGPDGRMVFSDGDGGRLFIADADATHAQALDAAGSRPTWSPDGSRIAFERWVESHDSPGSGAWNIASMKPDGSDVRVVTATTSDMDLYAAW